MCRAIDFDSPFQRECCCGRLAYAAAPASERPFPAPSLAGLVAVGTFAQGGPQVDVAVAGAQAAEVDARNPGAYIARRRTHAFLRWVMRNKLLVRVTIPHQDHPQPAPLSQHHRLARIRQLLTEEDTPMLADARAA